MKTTEGQHAEGWNDGVAGRPLNNTYGDNEAGWAYVEGYERGKLQNRKLTVEVSVRAISQHNQSILTLRKPSDHENHPSVQQQFPTDIAQYIKGLIEADQTAQKVTAVKSGLMSLHEAFGPGVDSINDVGARDNADGSVTVQMAKRSEQLDGIINEIHKVLDYVEGSPIRQHVAIEPKDIRRIVGYLEQIGIIADELKAAGK